MLASAKRLPAIWNFGDRDETEQPAAGYDPVPVTVAGDGWLIDRLYSMAVRLRLAAQSSLFEAGDPALRYYLVESGKLLVRFRQPGLRPAMEIVCDGTLLIYDCYESHLVSCDAVDASIVLAIDRGKLERAAARDAALAGALRNVHNRELQLVLKGLGIPARTRSDARRNILLKRTLRQQHANATEGDGDLSTANGRCFLATAAASPGQ